MYSLISCSNCGLVLDWYKISWKFASDAEMYKEDGSIDETKAAWSDYKEDFVPFIPCPLCGEKILK